MSPTNLRTNIFAKFVLTSSDIDFFLFFFSWTPRSSTYGNFTLTNPCLRNQNLELQIFLSLCGIDFKHHTTSKHVSVLLISIVTNHFCTCLCGDIFAKYVVSVIFGTKYIIHVALGTTSTLESVERGFTIQLFTVQL